MRFSPLVGAALLLSAALAAPSAARAQMPESDCGSWTPWDPIAATPILFGWRMCRPTSGRIRIQWRFGNDSPTPVTFNYRLYTVEPQDCSEKRGRGHFARGKTRLEGARRDDMPTGRKTVRETGFQQNYWLYVCLELLDEA